MYHDPGTTLRIDAQLTDDQVATVLAETTPQRGYAADSEALLMCADRLGDTGGAHSPWLAELWARAQRWRDARGITTPEDDDALTVSGAVALQRCVPPVLYVQRCLHPGPRVSTAVRRTAADVVLADIGSLATARGNEHLTDLLLDAFEPAPTDNSEKAPPPNDDSAQNASRLESSSPDKP